MFKNKRVFSVVLLENIPQIILQIVYIVFIGAGGGSIVAVAMSFSTLSGLEWLFSSRQ